MSAPIQLFLLVILSSGSWTSGQSFALTLTNSALRRTPTTGHGRFPLRTPLFRDSTRTSDVTFPRSKLFQLRGGGGDGLRIPLGPSRRTKVTAPVSSMPLVEATDDSSSATNTGGRASMTASAFNLVNNVAGAGILALSSSQASGTGWIPAILINAILGLFSARTFVMVGEACELLDESDFKGLWTRTIGESSAFVVDLMVALLCVAVSVIYSGILGDISTFLIKDLAGVACDRTSNILLITAFLLLPMSLIKDMSILAFTSILGFMAIMYTVVFIIFRAVDGSYRLGHGRFVTGGGLPLLPAFTRSSLMRINLNSLVLVSTLGLAYVAHYNAPTFYRQLKDASAKRFSKMVSVSFVLLIVLYVLAMGAGYSTFGDVCLGNILLNYHKDDKLATLGRLATWFSILFGFPLVFNGAREGLIGTFASLKLGKPETFQKYHVPFVLCLLAGITFTSCTVRDISLVMGLTGASFGSFLTYTGPTLIYVKAVALAKGKDSPEYRRWARYHWPLVPFGVFVGALGVYMTLAEAAS